MLSDHEPNGQLPMAFVITEACISCEACALACPQDAVIADDACYSIHPGKCDECGERVEMPHCLQVCPADCIGPASSASGRLNGQSVCDENPPLQFPRSRFRGA